MVPDAQKSHKEQTSVLPGPAAQKGAHGAYPQREAARTQPRSQGALEAWVKLGLSPSGCVQARRPGWVCP